jgi:hypothetical protein
MDSATRERLYGALELIARVAILAWFATLLNGFVRESFPRIFSVVVLAVLLGSVLGRLYLRFSEPKAPDGQSTD